MNWDFIPYYGVYEGQIRILSTQQNANRIQDNGYRGWRFTVRRNGTIAVIQHQIASNKAGENTKSTFGGSRNHDYPAVFPLGLRVFKADSNWQIDGAALRDVQWTYTNPDGASGSGFMSNNSRVIFEHQLDLAVSSGQRLLFLVYNRHPDPANNCPAVNMPANQDRPSLGLNPPTAVTPFYGDDPLYVRSGSPTGTLSPSSDRLYSLGIRYTDGVEDGTVVNDSNSYFNVEISGTKRARQRWSSPYWRKTSRLAVAVRRNADSIPESDLTVRITGPDISAVTLRIPVAQVPAWGEGYRHLFFDLPQQIVLAPNSIYTVELFSPDSSQDYILHAIRQFANGIASPANSDGSYVSNGTIDPHKWSGLAEVSSNGGSSWQFAGYGGGDTDLPIAFVLDRRMAATAEALPA